MGCADESALLVMFVFAGGDGDDAVPAASRRMVPDALLTVPLAAGAVAASGAWTIGARVAPVPSAATVVMAEPSEGDAAGAEIDGGGSTAGGWLVDALGADVEDGVNTDDAPEVVDGVNTEDAPKVEEVARAGKTPLTTGPSGAVASGALVPASPGVVTAVTAPPAAEGIVDKPETPSADAFPELNTSRRARPVRNPSPKRASRWRTVARPFVAHAKKFPCVSRFAVINPPKAGLSGLQKLIVCCDPLRLITVTETSKP